MSRRNRYKPYPTNLTNPTASGSSISNIANSALNIASSTTQRNIRRTTVAPSTLAQSPLESTVISASSSGKRPHRDSDLESVASADLDQFNGAGEDNHSDHEADGQGAEGPTNFTSSLADQTLDTPDTSPSSASGSNKPDVYTRLAGFPLLNFNRMAREVNLDEESKVMGQQLCSAKGGEDQFIACIVAILADRQEVRELRDEVTHRLSELEGGRALRRSDASVWKASKELRGVLRMLACQNILGGDVQAYTATEDRQGDQDRLPLCLFAKVMSAVLANPAEWKNRVLPPGYGSDPDPASTQALRALINTILKEVRKEFKDIFLSHINLRSSGNSNTSNANVPIIDTIIVKLYQKERDLVGGRVRVREEILEEVDNLRTARYAWLRMQAIHWGLNRGTYNNRSFWDVVDEKLEFLRSQSRRYRYAFFLLALQDDYDRIDGKKNFVQLKETNQFDLPTEQRIQDTIQELNQTFGTDVAPDEAVHEQLETGTA